jgi:hypothetical protein
MIKLEDSWILLFDYGLLGPMGKNGYRMMNSETKDLLMRDNLQRTNSVKMILVSVVFFAFLIAKTANAMTVAPGALEEARQRTIATKVSVYAANAAYRWSSAKLGNEWVYPLGVAVGFDFRLSPDPYQALGASLLFLENDFDEVEMGLRGSYQLGFELGPVLELGPTVAFSHETGKASLGVQAEVAMFMFLPPLGYFVSVERRFTGTKSTTLMFGMKVFVRMPWETGFERR